MELPFQIKRLTSKDVLLFQELVVLFQSVFEVENIQSLPHDKLNNLLEKPNFSEHVALLEKQVIGGLTAYELPMYYGDYTEMFIYDIAIAPAFQRKGVGKQLIENLKEYCSQNGIKEMFVPVHEEDIDALHFYQSTGGKAEKVVHFTYLIDNTNHIS